MWKLERAYSRTRYWVVLSARERLVSIVSHTGELPHPPLPTKKVLHELRSRSFSPLAVKYFTTPSSMDRDSPISSRSYEMGISVDQLESLWPPYRGSILLGTARESQGRVKNARVALTAGHVALSLEVNPATDPGDDLDEASSMFAKVKSTGVDSVPAAQISKPLEHNTSPRTSRPVLRLTVLLDAVPDGAPKPGIYQVTKFLTKVLAASEAGAVEEKFTSASSDAVATGTDFPGFDESALGEDIPEILVVKHEEDVSSNIRSIRRTRNRTKNAA